MALLGALGAAAGQGESAYVDESRRQDELALRRQQFERQNMLDQVTMQRAAREQADWQRQDVERQGLMAAGADVVPQPVAEVYQPAVDDDGNAMPANPTVGAVRMGGQVMPAADGAALAARQNTIGGRLSRQGSYMASIGKAAEAKHYADAAHEMEKEGYVDFAETNLANLPTLDDVKAGKSTFDLNGVDRFNAAGGKDSIKPGMRGQAFVTKQPNGQEVVDFRIVGADGQPLGDVPSGRQLLAFYGQNVQQRAASERQAFMDKTTADDKRTDNERQAARDAETARHNRALEGLTGRRIDETGAGKSALDRMPERDKIAYTAANARVKMIEEQITKAQVDPMAGWDPKKNPGQAALQTQLAVARQQAQGIYDRTDKAGGATPVDPLNLRRGDETRVSSAVQTQRDEQAGRDRILSEHGGDVGKARAAAARIDAEAAKATGETRAMLQRDAANLRAGIDAVARTSGAPAAPPKSATVPAPPVRAMQAVASPAPANDPVERLGVAVDQARQAVAAATATLQRYGSRQRQTDPDGFKQAQAAAAAAGATAQRAEQEYAAAVAAQPSMARASFNARPAM